MSDAGLNVRTIRQQVGMSLRAVAEAAGIDPATLSRIENGKTQLTGDLANKISAVLHVSAGMLFADAGAVETAMLRMRKAPLLTPGQLLAWNGPENFEEAPDQTYLHTGMEVASRYCFALCVAESANEPMFIVGDKLLFDNKRQPKLGDVVVAQTPGGATFIGRYRTPAIGGVPGVYSIVPSNRLFPEVRSDEVQLAIRGVLAEQRRYFVSV